MDNFVFENKTKIYFGADEMKHLGEEVARFGKNVLLIYGGGSIKKIGLYDRILKDLEKEKLNVFELSGVEPNPRHTTVNKGAAICKKEGIDVLLAVGGGSVIDCAKAIAAAAMYEGDDSWDLISKKAVVEESLPIVTVLTLAATGSEMDAACVITNEETMEKKGYTGPDNNPDVSFLNPEYTYTVSPYQTASGSVDIMAHVLDMSYLTDQKELDMLTRIQEEVMKTIVKYAPIALEDPDNYEARANLMWASSWALNGFLFGPVSQRAVAHAIEHQLSAVYDITHGHGLAIVLPRWLRYILNEETAPKIKRLGVEVFGVNPEYSDMEGAEKTIEAMEHFFFDELKLASTLSELGIDDKHFKEMAAKAVEPLGTLHSITTLTPEDVEEIYRMSL